MSKKDDLIKLKRNYLEIKQKIDEFGKEQFKDILELANWLEELIENTERLKKQEEKSNPDLRQRFKLGRKMQRAYKEDYSFEATVDHAIKEGKIPSDIADRFKEIAQLLKKRKLSEIKYKFEYFENLINLEKKIRKLDQELKDEKNTLQTKINKAKITIKELEELKNTDLTKIKLFENYLTNLEKLSKERKKYISYLISLKLNEIFNKLESLFDLSFPIIDKTRLQKLKEIFKESFFKNMTIQELHKYFDYSDQKLSHVYPEISKFNSVIRKERVWFDQILNLEKTKFLTWDNSEKLPDKFKDFFKGIGVEKIIKELEEYEKELPKFKEQYETYENYKLKKQELKAYSKENLEKEIKECEELLNILDLTIVKEKQSQNIMEKFKSFFN